MMSSWNRWLRTSRTWLSYARNGSAICRSLASAFFFLCGAVLSGPRTTKSGKNLRPRRSNRKTSQSEGTRRIRRYVLRQATVAVVFPCHRYTCQSCPPPL
uniref:(northern house mosquito) hypothetical protein n=1 Tax=Culex pipiens TaxID=7175 RepID=A0A8D8H283_CULPI